MENNLLNETKCIACKKWTNGSKTHCQHCNSILETTKLENERQERHENYIIDIMLIKIKPTDHIIVVGIKKVLQAIQIVYMAILSFILWIIAMLPG